MAKLLGKLPADGFESAEALADALGNASYTAASSASVTGAGARGGSALTYKRVAIATSIVAVLAIAAEGARWMRRPPSAPQVVRFSVPIKSSQTLFNARADAPFALSPDGTRLVYAALDSGAVVPTLHLRALDQFTTTALRGTEAAYAPFFSPDGLWIGFLTPNREVKKIAVSGGSVETLVTGAALYRAAPSWGDDHAITFPGQGAGPVWQVGDGGGKPTLLFDSTKVGGMAPFVLPGGQAALYTVCPSMSTGSCVDGDLAVLDLAAKTVKVLVPGAARGWYLPSGHLIYGTREGVLFAVKFNLKSLTVTSAPVAVLDGIQLTNFLVPAVAISASGTMAYLPGGSFGPSRVIVQLDRTGREEVIVAKPGSYQAPRLSPDGRRVAVADGDSNFVTQIWIHDRVSATTRQLTFDGSSARPAWSPDGSRVAFSTSRGGAGATRPIWSVPADGAGPGAREGEGPGAGSGAAAVSWTRDGKWILTDGLPEDGKGAGGEDVFAIPTSGSPRTMRPAVATRFHEATGEVSPDGKWIAYISDETGPFQVYVQPFLVAGERTLISAGRASEPVWMSNNELAYIDNETDSLTVARLEFGATTTVTRTALFGTGSYIKGGQPVRNFDVSRDGKSFIFVKPLAEKEAAEPIVVLNWIEEVKRLMAAAGIK